MATLPTLPKPEPKPESSTHHCACQTAATGALVIVRRLPRQRAYRSLKLDWDAERCELACIELDRMIQQLND